MNNQLSACRWIQVISATFFPMKSSPGASPLKAFLASNSATGFRSFFPLEEASPYHFCGPESSEAAIVQCQCLLMARNCVKKRLFINEVPSSLHFGGVRLQNVKRLVRSIRATRDAFLPPRGSLSPSSIHFLAFAGAVALKKFTEKGMTT